MNENSPLSMDQLVAVLDNAPVAVYVTAMDDWELLYANLLAREFLSRSGKLSGGPCYQAAGFDKPCPFCKVARMNREELLVREFENPRDGRVYRLSGKLIDWAGRPAHIEYLLDITEKKRHEAAVEALNQELLETFRNIPSGLSVYRFDGGQISPLYHNPAFYEIMGYSEEHKQSIERQTAFLGVHPDDLPSLQEKIQRTIQQGGIIQQTYRVFSDQKQEYRFIHLDGSVRTMKDKTKTLYAVYSDVSEQQRLEKELTASNVKLQDVVNAIPGGVAIYKVSDIFEPVYYSDGVPELTGYTPEEYQNRIGWDAALGIFPEDMSAAVEQVRRGIREHTAVDLEFRKLHRDGHIVWVHVQAKQIGEEDGCPLLQCVFHNISALKEAQLRLNHLINSIPGGIASYRVEGGRFIPTYCSDGVAALLGYTPAQYDAMLHGDMLHGIYEPDRQRVLTALHAAMENGTTLDISYRKRHKKGALLWIHLNGRRMGPLSEVMDFYAVFSGMPAEARLFQNIADETADGIYVIDKNTYEVLYANDSDGFLISGQNCIGQKCYAALQGQAAPCEQCTLKTHAPDGVEHEMVIEGSGRSFATRFQETDWNGIPAYIKFVRDVTEEVETRREKERLAMYFQTVVESLPGGIAVIRCDTHGRMTPEYISDGFAAMTHMTVKEAEALYEKDVFAGVHPDDVLENREKLKNYLVQGKGHCALTQRMRLGDGGYIWVKNTVSVQKAPEGGSRLYSVYTDITRTVEEKERMHRQYEDIILQHYRTPSPDTLVLGHCNVSQNKILEIWDSTNSGLLDVFGDVREEFFTGLSSLVVDETERRAFLDKYLGAPALEAYRNNETEQLLQCYVKLPQEELGRYVQIKMNLVETPDTGDVTGILTVTDITEKTISDRILHQLSVTSHDYVVDLNLSRDSYTVLTFNRNAHCVPEHQGCHSKRVTAMARSTVVPRDSETYEKALEPEEIRRRLVKSGPYTFTYSITDEQGDIRTKNMTVSAIDLRLGRVCLVCTDITDSVREQQGLLNMLAYTFELMGFLDIGSACFTMYTREMVLKNLPPYLFTDYNDSVEHFTGTYVTEEGKQTAREQFRLDAMRERLRREPAGFDFVFPYQTENGLRYKQINVLWGDENHRTICLVRADVTDILAAERSAKKALEDALSLAEEANQTKSNFLSAMSHDIRTPMNAIINMTTLGLHYIDEKDRVKNCLKKIAVSSQHLLSLVNDVLDMSRLEQSKVIMNPLDVSLTALMEQISVIMEPQAESEGLHFTLKEENIAHPYFYGDALRVKRVLINLLSNAVKFTPGGGCVELHVEEVPPHTAQGHIRYRFTVRDTGIGMSGDFLKRVFDPFVRDSSVLRIEGTGLGLSITKGLVELMGGDIQVESQLHKGSVFRVELEFEAAQGETALHTQEDGILPAETSKTRIFDGRRFLIAEDSVINAEIICELLAIYGAACVVKPDGAQTVEAFKEAAPGTYDAVLMDIQMPVMNGYEAARALRGLARPDAKAIPIVAITANAFAEDVQKALDAGMNTHVAKPIDVDLLRNTLSKVLRGHAPLQGGC